MNERARRVLEVTEQVIRMPDVQPGFPDANGNTNVTWCNRALHRILVMLGARAALLLEPRGIGWTNANAMVRHAGERCQPKLEPETAQAMANDGKFIIAVAPNTRGPGHVEMVIFDTDQFNPSRGARVGGAGATNGIGYVRPRFANLEVEYYEVPAEAGCAD